MTFSLRFFSGYKKCAHRILPNSKPSIMALSFSSYDGFTPCHVAKLELGLAQSPYLCGSSLDLAKEKFA